MTLSATARRTSFLLCCCLLLVATQADIYTFKHEVLPNNTIRARPGYMYALQDAPTGNKRPYIRLALTLTWEGADDPHGRFVEVVVVEGGASNFRDDLGMLNDKGHKVYCCNMDTLHLPACHLENSLIVSPRLKNVWRATYHFAENGKPATLVGDNKMYVNKTGLHYLIVSNCNEGDAQVYIDGKTLWMNPYGYLPGQLYNYLPFYSYMSLIYIGVAFVWFLFNVIHWKEVVMLQNAISAVLGLCLIEMATWYFDYINFNHTGERHVAPFTVGILSSVLRRAVSRMLVIAVSLGYGVVRPSLGEDRCKIFTLGGLYFAFGAVLELLVHYGQTNVVDQNWKLLCTLPVAALDAYAYWWIFISLYQLTSNLHARKQRMKLALYKRFFGVLVCSLLAALGFACYQVWFMATNELYTHWREFWMIENGFWQILYTALLFSIMFLWRPNKNSRRYAYAELEQWDEEDGDDMMMDDLSDDDFQQRKGHSTRANGHRADDDDDDEEADALFEIGDEDDDIIDANVVSKMS